MHNIIYTMKRESQGNLTALIFTPDTNRDPLEMSPFKGPVELHQAVKERHGDNVVFVSPRAFNVELEKRRTHSDEMLEILKNSGEGDLSRRWVYGSPYRPMGRVWARIEGAVFIHTDWQSTGYHTYAVVPSKLDKEIIENYDLIFVSHGGINV